MPIYEYQCERCGHRLEALQSVSELPLKECPACHETALNKLISAASFQLKGTGWYATDFRNKGKPEATKSDNAGKNDSKTDSKNDSKTSGETGSTTNTTKTDQGTGTL